MHPLKAFHVARGSAQDLDIGPLRGAVVAIGNFDGVHRGHRAVIDAARARARKLGRKAAALTFAPHPRLFLRPQDPLFQLSAMRDKLRLLAATGLDGAIVMNFDATLAATSAQDFIERILVGRMGIGGATIGFDFHFGQNRGGSPAYLAEQGARLGFAVDIVPPLEDEGRPVSSGAVRQALAQGEVVEAAELLGAPWFVSGEVIHGEKRGRELGFPTANLRLDPSCALKHGIYAVRVDVGGVRYDGVASFGRAADVRQRRAAPGSVPVRLRRRSLRAGDRRRLHRLDPPRAEFRDHRSPQAPDGGRRRPGARRAQALRQGVPEAGGRVAWTRKNPAFSVGSHMIGTAPWWHAKYSLL